MLGRVEFKSGVAIGAGLTTSLRRVTNGVVTYCDTPGLADIEQREAAAKAIATAFAGGGAFKVFFVVTLEAGKVRASDVQTMREILARFPSQPPISIGLIVNKVTASVARVLKDSPSSIARLQEAFDLGSHRIGSMLLVHKVTELDDANDCLLKDTQAARLQTFVSDFRATDLRKPSASVDEVAKKLSKLHLAEDEKRRAEERRAQLERQHQQELATIKRKAEEELARREAALREQARRARQEQLEMEKYQRQLQMQRQYEYEMQYQQQQMYHAMASSSSSGGGGKCGATTTRGTPCKFTRSGCPYH